MSSHLKVSLRSRASSPAGLLRPAEMFPGGGQWSQPDGTSSGSLAVGPGGVRGMREGHWHACAFPTSPLQTDVEKPPVFVLLTMTRANLYLTEQDGFSRGIRRPVVHKAGASILECHVLV